VCWTARTTSRHPTKPARDGFFGKSEYDVDPDRLVLRNSWSINLQWQIEPNLANASEEHVTFTPQRGGGTLVELAHRHFDRHGPGWEALRDAVDAPNAWNLRPFAHALVNPA
jgi:hypothetical protein